MKWLLAVVLMLAIPASATATTFVTTDGSDAAPYAQAQVGLFMATPPTIRIEPRAGGCQYGPAPWPIACADSTGLITVDPERVLTERARMIIAHETGHIVDFTIAAQDGGALRARMLEVFERTADKWTSAYQGDSRPPMEEFADTWAVCALDGPVTGDPYVVTPSYNFQITPTQLAQACELMGQAAAAAGFDAAQATPPASWRKMPQPGDCFDGTHIVACAKPAPVRRHHPRWWRILRRWHWGARTRHYR